MILLDTNLLTRITDSKHPQCSTARGAINKLTANRERLVIVAQNLYEFWAVATRPAGAAPVGQNGLGMSTDRASQWVLYFQRRFALQPDPVDLLPQWHQLVKTNRIRGFKAHDVRLAAAMLLLGIPQILTFNVADFKALSISVIDPATV